MSTPRGTNPSIGDIVKSITDGEYRIPRFQRDFVWDVKKSASLLDSVLKGYPIGAVILWKTKEELSEIREFGGIKIPEKDTGKYTCYIIDGQQRLTSLYFALNGLKTETGLDFSSMCISLTADNDEQVVFDAAPKDANPDAYVNLHSLFSSEALGGTYPESRIKYFQILMQYTVSVIEIDDENLGLGEVIEIFERLNLGGKKLNMFSIIAARSYRAPTSESKGFDLAKEFDKVNKDFENNNYGRISEATFLQAISACMIGKVNKTEMLQNLNSELISENYVKVEKALRASIEYLKGYKYGVVVSNLLPYESLLVPFTYFHYKNGTKKVSPMQEKYLLDFFWRSVIGKRYNSSAGTHMNADIVKIQTILDGDLPQQESITLSPKSIFENGRFMLSSAYVIGILCLMAQMNPQSFAPGKTINITNDSVSSGAESQFHHFFPLKSEVVINNESYQAVVNNVVNIVFLDALTNKQVGNKNPSDYIPEFVEDNPNIEDILKAHYISLNTCGINDNNFSKFLNSRSKALFNKLCEYIIPTRSDLVSDESFTID